MANCGGIATLYQKYCKLLQTSENHIRIDYLTQKKDNKEILNNLQPTVNNIIDDFYKNDFEKLMAKYNHK